jgi:translation initiation factor 4E
MGSSALSETYLNDIWAMYFHDPYDHNWNIESYKLISTISSVEEFVNVFTVFKDLFYKGMFFLMREHITPRWEDEHNKNGGCFSYKLNKFALEEKFFEVCSQVLGEVLGKTDEFSNNINGISISPKKNYYIIRIWIKNNKYASKNNYNIGIPKFSTLMYKNHADTQDK